MKQVQREPLTDAGELRRTAELYALGANRRDAALSSLRVRR